MGFEPTGDPSAASGFKTASCSCLFGLVSSTAPNGAAEALYVDERRLADIARRYSMEVVGPIPESYV